MFLHKTKIKAQGCGWYFNSSFILGAFYFCKLPATFLANEQSFGETLGKSEVNKKCPCLAMFAQNY